MSTKELKIGSFRKFFEENHPELLRLLNSTIISIILPELAEDYGYN